MKTHLFDSSVPAVEGSDLEAICGAKVSKSAFVFMWDEQEIGVAARVSHVFIKGMCSKCRNSGVMNGRYIYGIADGEEMKQRVEGAQHG